MTAGRLIVVFGCGGDRDRAKRPLMGRPPTANADLTIITSDNPRSEDPLAIIAEIEPGAVRAAVRSSGRARPARRDRAAVARRPGDVVVIAGQGPRDLSGVAEPYVDFDDRTVARERSWLGGAYREAAPHVGRCRARWTACSWARTRRSRRCDRLARDVVRADCSWPFPASARTGAFVPEAFENGAAGVLVRDGLTVEGPAGVRPSTNEALIQAGRRRARARMAATMVGITGANGKTSAKDMTGGGPRPPGSGPTPARTRSTTRSACRYAPERAADTEVVVAEMGARRAGDVTMLCAGRASLGSGSSRTSASPTSRSSVVGTDR